MSKISILGFLSASEGTSIASSPIHWSILVSPLNENASQSQTQLKSKPRLFRLNSAPKQLPSDTILFDMHDHQLRQQPYPVPVKSSSNDSETDEVATTRTSIASSDRNQLLRPVINVYLAPHHSVPSKLVPKLSSILYQTPTYGPEDDWLRAALEHMICSRILGSDTPTHIYSAPSILDFIHDCLSSNSPALSAVGASSDSDSSNIIQSDYTLHLVRLAQAKAMFNHSATPSRTSSTTGSAISLHDEKSASSRTASSKSKKHFLGFWLTHGSSGQHLHRRQCAYNPHPWQRQDDPYGGLM
ncbi:hypothetical protein RBB50_003037 [Rhinocladiella similis]